VNCIQTAAYCHRGAHAQCAWGHQCPWVDELLGPEYTVVSEYGTRIDPDPGDVLHASMDASWRSSWARHSDVPIFTKCIQLDLLVSLLTCLHRPPCSRTACLLDIAWPGNLAGQGAVPIAEVQVPCSGTYRVTLAVLLLIL